MIFKTSTCIKEKMLVIISILLIILLKTTVYSISCLGDLDGIEGIFHAKGSEIVTISDDGQLTVWNRYRKVVSGWPKALSGKVFYTSPILKCQPGT